ncbi:hypothetical protein QBC43DRAFT_294185 [Cladorrhinum sp. PSN259]|nr:hypothetical protein QBC43DRAFT_294185 [Cladorrhinum sp. PSN259]
MQQENLVVFFTWMLPSLVFGLAAITYYLARAPHHIPTILGLMRTMVRASNMDLFDFVGQIVHSPARMLVLILLLSIFTDIWLTAVGNEIRRKLVRRLVGYWNRLGNNWVNRIRNRKVRKIVRKMWVAGARLLRVVLEFGENFARGMIRYRMMVRHHDRDVIVPWNQARYGVLNGVELQQIDVGRLR